MIEGLLEFVGRGQAAQRAIDKIVIDRPRMMYAGQCELHGGYPGDALNRPELGDISICMECGALSLFKDRNTVRDGRILPSSIAGIDEISPPLTDGQTGMLLEILAAIKKRRAARG
jgi:hypothetical protein